MTNLCIRWERIANEILMYFRSPRKSAQDVSLSDYIETGAEGAPLELMDVLSEDCDLLEEVSGRETVARLRRAVERCLSLSRSYISRIEKRALGKLRAELE